MSATTHPGTDREYQLDSGTDLGREQLGYLETLLDRHTLYALDAVGVRPGHRCLDLGAGSGSISRRLGERVAPSGSVRAVDIETRHLTGMPAGVEVLRHDINDGVPGGPYDIIHARLLLMHLTRRAEILRELAGALAPGGWLVIGEYVGPQRYVLAAPGGEDEALFHRVQRVAHGRAQAGGISYTWAHEVATHMAAAGLVDVYGTDHRHTADGGTTACLLSWNYIAQLEPRLLAAGFTADELDRYHALMRDPRVRAWFYPFVSTRGRKPAA